MGDGGMSAKTVAALRLMMYDRREEIDMQRGALRLRVGNISLNLIRVGPVPWYIVIVATVLEGTVA